MKDKLIIVSNESILKSDVFIKDTRVSIVDSINEFSKENKLKFNFRKSEINKAPDKLARSGYMIIKTQGEKGIVWIYLPKVVSNNQMKWLNENKEKLKKYNTVGVFNYKNWFSKPDNLMSTIELMKEAENKNKNYKGSEKDAR